MIVMKFGGTSVADAERILSVAEIIDTAVRRDPVVVVSAMGGITDLLVRAVAAASRGDRAALEPVVSEIDRRHRQVVAGAIEDSSRRHALSLEVERLLDELRHRLRSLRVLAESTPRATDAILASGESLAAAIITAALVERGVQAELIDAREVMITSARHASAEPVLEAVRVRAAERILPRVKLGRVPVLGGFIGATSAGETTTLGRGGSDTSAAVLGLALGVEEIQIWSDVDGLMTADPRLVPEARPLSHVSFAEAAELAFFGAKVLHPASIAPAVAGRIPVRVLNSLRPEASGTLVLADAAGAARPVSVASRDGLRLCRMRLAAGGRAIDRLPGVLARCQAARIEPVLISAGESGLCLAVGGPDAPADLFADLPENGDLEVLDGRALVALVGNALGESDRSRRSAIGWLADLDPDWLVAGSSRTSVTAVLVAARLGHAVRGLHRRIIESAPP